MTIHLTLEEALNRCNDWTALCAAKGWSEYAVREGGGDIEIVLTEEEALEYGIINHPNGEYVSYAPDPDAE